MNSIRERVGNGDERGRGIDSAHDLSRLERGRWRPLPEQEAILAEELQAPPKELLALVACILDGATLEEVKDYVRSL